MDLWALPCGWMLTAPLSLVKYCVNAFHLLSWPSCPCIKTTSSSVHDPTLFYLLKDISLFPYWQFPPLFWVIPVDIQISPIKTQQKQNNKQSAWLHLPGQSLLHFLTIIPTFFEVLLFPSYSPLPSSLEATLFRLLSLPVFRGTYRSLPCSFGNFRVTKSNGQFSVHTLFNSSGAFGTVVTLFETFNSLGLLYSLLFCLSSYILGPLLSFLWGFFGVPLGVTLQNSPASVYTPKWFYLLYSITAVIYLNSEWQLSISNCLVDITFGCLRIISNLTLFDTILFIFLLKLLPTLPFLFHLRK